MNLESWERETVISWDDSTKIATLSTYNKSMINKLDKLCQQHPNEYKMFNEIILDGEVVGKEYRFAKKLVSVRAPSTRKMTEEQKVEAGNRLRKARKNKQEI